MNLGGSNSWRENEHRPISKWVRPGFIPDYLGVVPDIWAAVDGIGDDDNPSACGEAPAINLRLFLQHAAMGRDRRVEPQTLLDAVLEICQLTKIIPADTHTHTISHQSTYSLRSKVISFKFRTNIFGIV